MKSLRIIYMGTPDFSAKILEALISSSHKIVSVITAPDKSSGRGQKTKASPVKQLALAHSLPILQPTNLKDDGFVTTIKSLKAEVMVVVAFRMLPKCIWEIPNLGCFNLHASLLPQYRGAAPINWAIINNEKTTGVTTFFLDKQIDTGDIILQKSVNIEPTDTAGTLHKKLIPIGSKLVLETLDLISQGNVKTLSQNSVENLKTAPKIFKATCKISWNDSTENIYHFVRGLSPYPTAWSVLKNGMDSLIVKIHSISPEKTYHQLTVGSCVVNKKSLKVAVSDGFIHIKSIQLPGRKPVDISSMLNGYKLSPKASFS